MLSNFDEKNLSLLRYCWPGSMCDEKKPELKTDTKADQFKSTFEIMAQLWAKELHVVAGKIVAVFLNDSEKVVGFRVIGSDESNRADLDIKLTVVSAISLQATMVVITQKRQDKNVFPREFDIDFTWMFSQYLSIFDMKIKDHLIFSGDLKTHFQFSTEKMFNGILTIKY